MRKTWQIAVKELKGYFLSPLAYVVVGLLLVLGGYFFVAFLLGTRLAHLGGYLANMGVVLMFTAPLLTMRLWAEEQQMNTAELLLTVPVSVPQMVLGKYLAALLTYAVYLLLTGVYPLILFRLGQPEPGPLWSGYLGLLLLGAAYLAVGLFASSLTASQMVAGVIGFALLLGFWVLDWLAGSVSGATGRVLSYLAQTGHYQNFIKGVFDSGSIVYFASIIFVFLFLTVRVIERRTWV